MKKLLLLSAIIVFLSCSKDDDGPTTNQISSTNLVGTWDLDYYVQNTIFKEDINCNELIRYVFLANNTYTKTSFSGSGSTNCAKAIEINGTWEVLADSNYQLTPNGGNPGAALDITFEDNFTKFVFVVNNTRTEVYSKK